MITKKVALTILAVLALGVLLYVLGTPGNTEAQTVPAWVHGALSPTTGTGAGPKHPVYKAAVGDRVLSMLQLDTVANLECTGWGRNFSGTWERIFPAPGPGDDADVTSDSTVTFTSGSPFLRFHQTKLEVLIIHGGTANGAWGE